MPAVLLTALALPPAAGPFERSPLAEEVRARVEAGCTPVESPGRLEIVCAGGEVRGLYARRGYEPAWVGAGCLLPAGAALVRSLEAAPEHGLRARDYHLEAIRDRSVGPESLPDRVRSYGELEILLTDAFLLYGAHLLAGRVDAEKIHPDWVSNPRAVEVVPTLERAVASGAVAEELASLAPVHPEYGRLREAIARYRRLAERDWPSVSPGPSLGRGDCDPRVKELRERLGAEGYAAAAPEGSEDCLDGSLDAVLQTFQRLHGLEPDGVLGPETAEALNVPAAARVRQLEVNLERWRWLPRDLGERHVRVDAGSFRLEVVEGGRPVLSMAVVAGRPFSRTPVFSSRLTAVILNPSWRVPKSIATDELLLEARRDPRYLRQHGYRVFRGETEVDPLRVDWASVSAERFGLRLVQAPGPKNALGRVKFVLPNRFDVYLHDTPARGLFREARRAFSHGCIRLERPLELAEYLLRGAPPWELGSLQKAIESGRERTVALRDPIPVHLLYTTARVDDGGNVHFGEDVYDRDPPTAEALEAPAPVAGPPGAASDL